MNEYQKRVLEGRKQFLKLQVQQEQELLQIYEEASRHITERLSRAKEGTLSNRYLTELDKSIKEYTYELRNKLGQSIKSGIMASSEIAANTQAAYFKMMSLDGKVKSTFVNMFASLSDDVAKTLINGKYYADGKSLNQRLWNITTKNAKDLDMIIKVNVAQQRSAGELAKQLQAYINPAERMVTHTRVPGINKNVAYQAQRLARTSMTHTASESFIQGSYRNPFCEGLKWNLSASHSARMHGKTDICDEYASKVFKPSEIPIQHPNCLCYFTQEVASVEQSREEIIAWLKGGNNPKLDKWYNENGKEFVA